MNRRKRREKRSVKAGDVFKTPEDPFIFITRPVPMEFKTALDVELFAKGIMKRIDLSLEEFQEIYSSDPLPPSGTQCYYEWKRICFE